MKRSLAALFLVSVMVAGCGASGGTVSTGTTARPTVPVTLEPLSVASAQLAADLSAATKANTLPAGLTPPLSDFASTSQGQSVTGPSYFSACDAYGEASRQSDPVPCVFGDTQSKRIIVLFGDSSVGNWAPALDLGLKAAGYRLDVFGFAGCLTPDISYNSGNDNNRDPNSTPDECNTWHAAAEPAIRALAPVAVIASAASDNYGLISNSDWIAGYDKLFAETTTPTTVRILIGSSPFFNEAAPTCLSTHPDPQACSINYSSGGAGPYSEYMARDPQIAASAHAKLIPPTSWLCSDGDCPPVIGSFLAYGDIDHLTIAFSEFLAPEVTSAVLTAIQGS